MGQRAKAKNNPTPIYRSRQAGRTDIEELLSPAFNPHQRLPVDTETATSLPRLETDSVQGDQPLSASEETYPLSTVDNPHQGSQAAVVELPTLLTREPEFSAANHSVQQLEALPTVDNDSVGNDPVDSESPPNTHNVQNNQKALSSPLPTVGSEPETTVGTRDGRDIISSPPLGTVGSEPKSPGSDHDGSTDLAISRPPLPTVPSDYGCEPQWITEQGQIVSEKQVRPFKIAQEVLNSNERVLYTVLWNHKEARIDSNDPHIRTVRAGYDLLAKQTNLAKKTIQRLIPRLLQKDFIRLNETPDFYNRVATSYQVFSYKRVLEVAAEQGRTHVAKLGHGIAFVRKRQNARPTETPEATGTVGSAPSSTVARKSTVSVPSHPPSTVVRKSTLLESRSVRKGETTTAPPELFERLETLVPEIDTGAVERIWREAREVLADIQPEEIAFWFEQRARIVYQNRGLTNPLGLLLSSIKDWLTERKVIIRRHQLRELAEEEQRVRQQLEEDQQKGDGNSRHEWGEK